MDTATKGYFGHVAIATYACCANNSDGAGTGCAI